MQGSQGWLAAPLPAPARVRLHARIGPPPPPPPHLLTPPAHPTPTHPHPQVLSHQYASILPDTMAANANLVSLLQLQIALHYGACARRCRAWACCRSLAGRPSPSVPHICLILLQSSTLGEGPTGFRSTPHSVLSGCAATCSTCSPA